MSVTIISPADLRLLIEKRIPLSIVDARGRLDYMNGHIPFAVPMNWEEWSARPPKECSLDLREPGYWGELAAPAALDYERLLSVAGITNQFPVVVYADGVPSKGREGRIAWMLLYLGVCRVYLLDGGWTAWRSSGAEIATGESSIRHGNFKLRLQHNRRVTLDQLRRLYQENALPRSVDTRSLQEFQGLSYDYQPAPGHLPGASSLTYESMFAEDGRYVSKTRFFALTPNTVMGDSRLFTYCEVGVRASTYAMLYEAYTGRVLPVYDGSIMEWGVYKDLPVLDGN